MKDLFDDIRIYLPKYLSSSEQNALFQELSSFPDNLDKRLFTNALKSLNILYQGDGVFEVEMPVHKGKLFTAAKCMLISNTCDTSLTNKRLYPPYFLFSPIMDLEKYQQILLKTAHKTRVESHINDIRKNKVTSFFYFPSWHSDKKEYFIRFDNIFNVPVTPELYDTLIKEKLFSLSNYGFYLLLIKTSIHFTRIQEAVKRG